MVTILFIGLLQEAVADARGPACHAAYRLRWFALCVVLLRPYPSPASIERE